MMTDSKTKELQGIKMDKNSIRKYVIEHLKPSAREQFTQKEIDDTIDEAIKICVNPLSVSQIFVFNSFDLYCEKCGECCRLSDPIRIQDEEILVYSQYFGNHFDKYVISKKGKWYFKKTKPCAFLSSTGRCNIYDIRPVVCRGYPFNNLDKIEVNTKCKVPINMAKMQTIGLLTNKLMDKNHPELKKQMDNMFKIDKKDFENMTPEQQLECGVAINQILKSKLSVSQRR